MEENIALSNQYYAEFREEANVVRKFEEQVDVLSVSEIPRLLLFHAVKPTLISADEHFISVWDYENHTRSTFKNDNRNCDPLLVSTKKISSLCLLNEHDATLLLSGSEDGIVRLWSSFDKPNEVQLISAWKALYGAKDGSKMLTDWLQSSGWLITSGKSDMIKIWDLDREFLIRDINLLPHCAIPWVTCLASDKIRETQFFTGFFDGSIRCFDMRDPQTATAILWHEHKNKVVNLSTNSLREDKIVSCSTSGTVKVWDRRKTNHSLHSFRSSFKELLAETAIHDSVPLIVSSSQKPKIRFMGLQGNEINLFRSEPKLGAISSLKFHPFLLTFAIASDSTISIYKT